MNLSRAFLPLLVLSVWTVGHTIGHGCPNGQVAMNNRCCNTCPPGTYLEKICSNTDQTICLPCRDGYYSDKQNVFDRCEKCLSCKQGYSENCTSTTRGTCSCWSGFLCSNNICTSCEKNECAIWEKPKRTDKGGPILTEYSYQCEPRCPEDGYFDVSKNTCEPWTKCSDLGLAERIPGNKTHNSVCYKPEIQRHDPDFIHVSLYVGFVFFSLSLFIFVSYTCATKIRKFKANNKPPPVVFAKSSEFHLSKEESGIQLMIQDDSQDSNSSDQPSYSLLTTSIV